MQRVKVDTYKVNHIPIITMYPEGAENCPIVLHIHGFEGNKTQGVELGYLLAQKGFFFVSVDAHLHGERRTKEFDDLFNPEHHSYPSDTGLDVYFSLFEIVVKTARDIDFLINHFGQDTRVDGNRIGVTGLSMGAFTTFYLTARNPKITAAASLIGFPSFNKRWRDAIIETSTYPRWSSKMKALSEETEKRSQWMQSIDPDLGLTKYSPKPLLMISGDVDTDAPKHYCLEMYRQLQPFYSDHPDNLCLSVYDGVGHRVTSSMRDEVCEWFFTHLGQ